MDLVIKKATQTNILYEYDWLLFSLHFIILYKHKQRKITKRKNGQNHFVNMNDYHSCWF